MSTTHLLKHSAKLLRLTPQYLRIFPSLPTPRLSPVPLSTLRPIRRASHNMASDEDYAAFLNKANQDTGISSTSSTTRQKPPPTVSVNTEVPQALQQVEAYYISEADEPFEPVSLKWDGDDLPSEEQFKDLIESEGEISTQTAKEFDPRGQYKDVIDTVDKAGGGNLKVFRVQLDRTRVEYYVVCLDEKGKRIVGVKAKAVET